MDFVPSREGDYALFVVNFSQVVSAETAALGLAPIDATALASLVSDFIAKRTLAQDPASRTRISIGEKQVAKALLTQDVRVLAARIQANPSVSVGLKLALQIPVHDRVPSPTPVPGTKPVTTVVEGDIRKLVVRISDETTPTKRARPWPATGCEFFSHVGALGEVPPEDLEQWRYAGTSTRSQFVIGFNQADVGKQATILTRWVNGKGQAGPTSNPVTRTIAA